MSLYFTNQEYVIKACQLTQKIEEKSFLSKEDAFIILIKDLKSQQLENLYDLLTRKNIDCEDLTKLKEEEKKRIYQCAHQLLKQKKPFGNETINDGKINTSAWINHSLWEGWLCSLFAEKMNLNPECAEVLGMLHDYGRKEIHTIQHVIRGFELLADMGYEQEARGCLTHSFLNGGRCASNEIAEPGFYVSSEGTPCWEKNAQKDDITFFLEQYEYDDYDRILNLADLMATSSGIVSPYERILDIATRRTIDSTNRGYFLAELIRMIAYISDKMRLPIYPKEYMELSFDQEKTIEDMVELLKKVSEKFYSCIWSMLQE